MKETHITIYIHDLEISDKSKSFLARVGLMKLDDLLNCNMTELSAMLQCAISVKMFSKS